MRRFRIPAGASAIVIAGSLVLSACGSSSNNASNSSPDAASAGTTATAAAASATVVAPSPPTAPPTQIGVTQALPKAPPKGKTVAFLECSLPACQSFVPGFEAATHALGWTLKTFSYQSPNAGPALQSAISAGVDYVASTGVPPALFKQQLAEAQAKHIPFISANDVTPPDPATDYMTDFGDTTMFGAESVQMAEWLIRKSGGDAHIVYVLIPDYPILQAGVPPLKQTVAKYCPKCTVDALPVTVNDVASGAVPGKLVAYLQTHPQVNYVDFSFADLLTGAEPALKAAGLTPRVKLVGQALGAGPQVIKAIENGTVSAWVAQPNSYQAWLMVDAMARLSENLSLSQERQAAQEPTWVVDSTAAAAPLANLGGWDGPAQYENAFKRLWRLS